MFQQAVPCNSKKKRLLPDNIFILSNGSIFPYSLPGDVGEQRFFRTQNTNRFQKALLAKKKEQLPLLQGWHSGTDQYLVIADFDKLPDGYAGFDRFYQHMRTVFKGKAVVTRSFSNKVKIFFLVETSDITPMNRNIALDTLEKLLPDDLYSYIDDSTSALSKSYITRSMYKELSDNIFYLEVIPAVLDRAQDSLRSVEGFISCIPMSSNHRYRSIETELDEAILPILIERFNDLIDNKQIMEKILKVLLATPQLLTEQGFDVVQNILAKTVGTTQKTISIYLNRILDAGFLARIDDSYSPGVKAITYQASGLLRIALHRPYIKPEYRLKSRDKGYRRLPVRINDGAWNDTMVLIVHCFISNPMGFLNWIRSIPGWNQKDRWKQANRIFRWRFRGGVDEYRNNVA